MAASPAGQASAASTRASGPSAWASPSSACGVGSPRPPPMRPTGRRCPSLPSGGPGRAWTVSAKAITPAVARRRLAREGYVVVHDPGIAVAPIAAAVGVAGHRAEQALDDLLGADRRQLEGVQGEPGALVRADRYVEQRLQPRGQRHGGGLGVYEQPVETPRVPRPQPHVDDPNLALEPARLDGQAPREHAAGEGRVVQRVDLQAGVALEHRAYGLEGAGRVALDREHGAVVLEMEVVREQQVDGARAVADDRAV